MTEHGWDTDEWPAIFEKVMAADILVLGMAIWLGEKTSVGDPCRRAPLRQLAPAQRRGPVRLLRPRRRLPGDRQRGRGQALRPGDALRARHLGYTIPPQADAGWIGEAGPGPSYLDEGSGGPENDFTNRNTTFMTWNLMHLARMLKDAGGIPAHGNQRTAWDAGCRSDFPNPEHR